jgi:transketolase
LETRGIVVAEEHLAYGGLGATVAMALAERAPIGMAFVDIGDTYATSGKPDELLRQFGLTPEAIMDQVRRILKD